MFVEYGGTTIASKEGSPPQHKTPRNCKRHSSAMFLAAFAGVFVAWIAYSIWQRRQLKSVFAAMQLLSETRRPHGDSEHAKAIAKTSLRLVRDMPEGWNFVAGDPMAQGGPIYRAGNKVACQFNADESLYGLYVPKLPQALSLPEIISKRPYGTYIEEDIASRANYMMHAQNSKSNNNYNGTCSFRGTYEWCFRDYVTQEELFGMLASRSCIEKTLFFPQQIGRITVKDDGSCTLHEQSLLFGFVPLQILWYGKINHQAAIAWETTCIRLGWKNYGKTFFKPQASERLRKDKWFVRYPLGYEQNGDFIVLYRENHGNLVYARHQAHW